MASVRANQINQLSALKENMNGELRSALAQKAAIAKLHNVLSALQICR